MRENEGEKRTDCLLLFQVESRRGGSFLLRKVEEATINLRVEVRGKWPAAALAFALRGGRDHFSNVNYRSAPLFSLLSAVSPRPRALFNQ